MSKRRRDQEQLLNLALENHAYFLKIFFPEKSAYVNLRISYFCVVNDDDLGIGLNKMES